MSFVSWLTGSMSSDGLLSPFKGWIDGAFSRDDPHVDTVEEDDEAGVVSVSINGTTSRFETGEETGDDILEWTLDIEGEWLEDLLREIKVDDVFFDVGANLGVYSCFVLNELTEGRVIAFEPYPPNIRQLRRNLSLNDGHYRVVDRALADEEARQTFTSSNSEDVGYATGTLSPDQADSGFEISTVRGDELVQDGTLPPPDILKIDVEGSEPLVLGGLQKTLSDSPCRIIYCEIHLSKEGRPSVGDYGSSPESIKETIRELGFSIDEIVRRNQELHLKAIR